MLFIIERVAYTLENLVLVKTLDLQVTSATLPNQSFTDYCNLLRLKLERNFLKCVGVIII